MATRKRRATAYDERGRATTGAYAVRLTDLHVATKAVGDTPAAQLAWVVRFVAEDPKTWHSHTRAAHGDCLIALAKPHPEYLKGGVELPEPLQADEVEALHEELRTTLRAMVNVEMLAPVGRVAVTQGVVRLTGVGVKPAVFAPSYDYADGRAAILQAVNNLVLRAGERLRACPVCRGPFMAVRKQSFCTTRCAQRARNERHAPKRARKTERRRTR